MDPNVVGQGELTFLLAEIGAHAASQFAEKLKVLGLAPPDACILRQLRVAAGLSQKDLSAKLNIHPSSIVAILDVLEKRRLVERRPNPHDRRLYSIQLTRSGEEVLGRTDEVTREHHEALFSALNNDEQETLGALLLKIVDQQGLVRGVHPRYQPNQPIRNQKR